MTAPAAVAAWDALAARASQPNPFFESWYLLPALSALDPNGRLRILRVEADGALIGLMPLWRDLRYYGRPVPHLAGWTHPNAFLGAPLVARDAEAAFWQALLDWADRSAGLALFLHLSDIPLEGALYAALAGVL
ncbi:MAG TPA: cellulose biosynthesis protein CelD, partial [Novosphingobium sp.]|nr:cellulose biosynthesis protein CelD [Novosphingobium sp.]